MEPTRPLSPRTFVTEPQQASEQNIAVAAEAFETTAEQNQVAQAQNEMFVAGARSGGVTQVVDATQVDKVVLSREEKLNACMKEFLDPVIRVAAGIMQNVTLLLTVTAEQAKAVAEYKVTASCEELALYNHFSQMILQQCTPILLVLPDQFKQPFSVLLQSPLQQKMPEAVEKIKSISPEFLINVQLVAYKPKLDELVKYIKSVDHKDLEICKGHLAAGTQGEDTAPQQVREVYECVAGIPVQIRADCAKYLVKGINSILKPALI